MQDQIKKFLLSIFLFSYLQTKIRCFHQPKIIAGASVKQIVVIGLCKYATENIEHSFILNYRGVGEEAFGGGR